MDGKTKCDQPFRSIETRANARLMGGIVRLVVATNDRAAPTKITRANWSAFTGENILVQLVTFRRA